MTIPAEHLARIGGRLALETTVTHAASVLRLGDVDAYSVIKVGYEDCNVDLRTTIGRFVVKIFASSRAESLPVRTVRLIQDAIGAGVRHPPVLSDGGGRRLHSDPGTGNSYLVMEFAEGRTYADAGRPPSDQELSDLLAQVALIHSIDADPTPVTDLWAVQNLAELASLTRPFIKPDLRPLIDIAVSGMRAVDAPRLPERLIHGDLTKGNVLVTSTGTTIVVDFAVAGRHPRIQELAVMAANLMHGDPRNLRQRASLLASLYDQHAPLNSQELAALPLFIQAAVAMEYLGALYERVFNDNSSSETTYLLELGEAGVRMID